MTHFIALPPRERERAYEELCALRRNVQIHSPKLGVKQGLVEKRSSGFIYLKFPAQHRFDGAFDCTVTFSLAQDIYFLKARVTCDEFGKVFFPETDDIFRLQRRDSFRLVIPANLEGEAQFGKDRVFRVYDVSQGGFSLLMDPGSAKQFLDLKNLVGSLSIVGEVFPKVLCNAKHLRRAPVKILMGSEVLVGFQFLKLSAKDQQRVFRVITEIARKFFKAI